MKTTLALAAALLASAQTAGGPAPAIGHWDKVEWKVSASLPSAAAGHEYHLLFEDPTTHGVQTLVRFAKGYALPPHTHSVAETIVVLDGKLLVELGGKKETLSRGSYAVIPANTPHSLTATKRVEMIVSFSGPVDFKGLPK